MARTLIVTPTYNERDNLERFVSRVRASLPEAHVLVVDELAAKDDHVRVLHRAGKLGLGTAYVEAFERGLAEGYERFFEMDADMSHDPKYLAAFVAELDGGADVVIGSRNIPGGGVEGWGIGRQVLSKGGSLYSRAILGLRVKDLTSGYKAFSRRALEAIRLDTVRSNGYSFQVELTYRAILRGMKVSEVPIIFVDRKAGYSKMSGKVFLEAVGMVWKLRADALMGKL
jgi:dolichol-phosphate mannosyltransferase